VAEYVPGATNRRTNSRGRQQHGTLDHPGGCPGGGVAPNGPHAIHRCLRGRSKSSLPPLLNLLPIASRVRNKRNGAGMALASVSAHHSSVGNVRSTPVAVGLVVAHTGVPVAGSTIHLFGKSLQRSRRPTGTGSVVAQTNRLLEGSQMGNTSRSTRLICIKVQKGS